MSVKKSWLVAATAAALALSACGGGATEGQSGAEGAAPAGAPIVLNGSEPQKPLLPGLTTETGGGRILSAIGAGLTYYGADGSTHNELAEDISSEDNKLWTIKIKQGKKFSDGSEVKAKNFVDSWVLIGAEAQDSVFFFEPVVGYSDDENVKHDLAQGIKLVDDYTFTVELKQPEADFPARLGYTAFYPLADASLADLDAAGENPITAGPYMLAGEGAWEHNEQINLVPNPNYDGDRKPKNDGLTFKFYTQLDSAYNDLLGGSLDVIDAIPDSAYGSYAEELANNGGGGINQAAAIFQSFAIPHKGHFDGEEGKLRRQAISMAVNRDEVTETIFLSTRTPAKDFTSPVVDGFNDSLPGSEVLSYNPEKAKELWAKADAITPWDGKFTIAYNADGGHEAWVTAVTNSIKNTLGIEAEGKAYPDFKSFRNDISEGRLDGAFRTGWQGDYPSKFNFLAPLYGTTGSSNDTKYSNPEFDKLLTEAAGAASLEEASKTLDKAQEILLQDLPVIPTWYSNVNGGWGANVENVVFNWQSQPLYYEITRK